MVSTRSADVAFLIGKPIDRLSSLKLPTNLEVMQRLLTCDEVVLLGQKVADGSTPGYTCHLSVNAIKTRINTLWEEYRATQAWGKRSSKEQSKASENFEEKLKSLFDIAKQDWKFVHDQRMKQKSTFGKRDTKLLARLKQRRYAKKTTRDGRTRQRRRKRCSQWFWGVKKAMGQLRSKRVKISVSLVPSNGRIWTGSC